MGGSDLVVGDSLSGLSVVGGGWLAANETVGHSPVDLLYLRKNFSSDLSQYIPPLVEMEADDLAAPCEPAPTPESRRSARDTTRARGFHSLFLLSLACYYRECNIGEHICILYVLASS